MTLNIPRDFSEKPGARYEAQGPNSGEVFYRDKLRPMYLEACSSGESLTVIFDGALGYPPSFLDQSFGSLAREFGVDEVCRRLTLIYNADPRGPDRIWKIIKDPKNRAR